MWEELTEQDFEIAKQNGISRKNARNRVDGGWTVQEAITKPLRKSSDFMSVWREWEDIAKSNGIDRELFRERMRKDKQGMTAEKAATTPKREAAFTYEELEIMKRNNIHPNTVSGRMRFQGMSREDAINTPRISYDEWHERVVKGVRKYHEQRREREND